MPQPLPALAPLLDHPLDGVARVEVDHRRRRRFRWLVLVEGALALGLCVCAIPVALALAFLGGDGDLPAPDLDDLARRAWIRWHEVGVRLVGGDGATVAEARVPVATAAQGDAAVGALLALAGRGRVVVVERIEGGPPTAAWYGGQPLLQPPTAVDAARAQRVLERAGVTVTDTEDGALEVTLAERRPGRVGAWILLLLLGPVLALGGRLGETWADARGVPARRRFRVDRGGLLLTRTRGGAETWRHAFDKADVLGLCWAPVLGYAPEVARHGPRLRVFTAVAAGEVDVPGPPDLGPAVRDLLVAGAQRLWADTSPAGAPAHCPYCSTLYPFVVGGSCPSCGAPPTALHGLAPT